MIPQFNIASSTLFLANHRVHIPIKILYDKDALRIVMLLNTINRLQIACLLLISSFDVFFPHMLNLFRLDHQQNQSIHSKTRNQRIITFSWNDSNSTYNLWNDKVLR